VAINHPREIRLRFDVLLCRYSFAMFTGSKFLNLLRLVAVLLAASISVINATTCTPANQYVYNSACSSCGPCLSPAGNSGDITSCYTSCNANYYGTACSWGGSAVSAGTCTACPAGMQSSAGSSACASSPTAGPTAAP
jgi:hypothetical protein